MRTRVLAAVLGLAAVLAWPGRWGATDEAKAPKASPRAYEVPYRMTGTRHVLVRVKFNGKGPYNFIVDSGAPAVVLARAVCQEVGVKPDERQWVRFDTVEVEGGLKRAGVRGRAEDMFQLQGMNGLGVAGVKLHGVLGYEFLAHYRLEFDFTRATMTWTELDYKPQPFKAGGGGTDLRLEAIGQVARGLGWLLGKGLPEVRRRGFLGVELRDGEEGVAVAAVLAGGAAAKAGIEAGDRITAVRGTKVRTVADVVRLTGETAEGEGVKLSVVRGGSAREVAVTFGEGL